MGIVFLGDLTGLAKSISAAEENLSLVAMNFTEYTLGNPMKLPRNPTEVLLGVKLDRKMNLPSSCVDISSTVSLTDSSNGLCVTRKCTGNSRQGRGTFDQ